MKIIILSIALVLSTGFAVAEEKNQDDSHKYCSGISWLSSEVMKDRQDGKPISKVIDSLNGLDLDPSDIEVLLSFAFKAYEQPRENSEVLRIEAKQNFENYAYIVCKTAISNNH